MVSRSTSILTIAGITAVSLVAYAVYFDFKRRNDAAFRKNLRKEKKRVEKSKASEAAASVAASSGVSGDALKEALEQVKKEVIPEAPEQKEEYFMTQVGMGEQLALQGPDLHIPAALCFFRALRVYPSPVELMVIYQKTVPEPIFNLVIQLTQLDNVEKIEGYYHAFPPKSMNIAVEVSPQDQLKKILVATKDFKAGDVIYQEHPLVAALDPDIQAAKSHCSHCLRVVDSSTAIKVTADPLAVVYCSSACQSASKSQHHAILFTLEPVLPPQATEAAITPEMIETRRKVQLQFAEYLQKHEGNNLLLVARFVARQIVSELTQFIPSTSRVSVGDFTDADGKKYSLGDHLERLRYIDVPESQQSRQVFSPVLEAAIPSLSAYIVDDRFNQLLGKMAYNAFGVCFEGGRDDKPASMVAPEDAEHTRTPYGTSHQIGSALYTLSSYLTHSCVPSARPAFTKGTSELHLIAERDIKKGEELTVAFVQVSQRPGESTAECRRRRRYEIARGWKFACGCARCSDELVSAGPTDELADMKDESKTDHAPQAYEAAKSALASGDVE